ncbi:Putative histidine kinase KdpD (fragment) [uncultured delta proteobacterium]|uniref:histidine kinase n=1 Tax=uncultured delta proteobacterium TaxID=34034 RepID=A0A212JBE8_9DELT
MIVKTLQKNPRIKADTTWRDAFMSVFILGVCSLIGLLFHSLRLSEANIISIYIIGILLISSIASSWAYGVMASVSGVLLFNFLYADPTFNFRVYDLQYSITTTVMLVASLIANYVMTLFRSQLDREILEIHRLDILLETSQHLQQAQNIDDIFTVALTQLHQMFARAVFIFPLADGALQRPRSKVAEGNPNLSPEAIGLDIAALEEFVATDNEKKSTVLHLNADNKAICFKLISGEAVVAAICIIVNSAKRTGGFEYNLVLAMLDEIALSVEKYNLQVFNERIAQEAEAERLRANLLRSISHDLRTPLTSISGNADILLSSADQIEPELRRQLYQNIYSDAEWLMNLVENLLFVTRIDNGVMTINTEYEVLQEIIQESLRYMAKRAKDHTIHLEMPEEILLVKMDARLIMQVIINIVDNAVKYTPAGSDIRIRALRRGSRAVVEVADTGNGISDDEKQKVFEMFYTTNKNSSDSRRGIGLGLPLCRSIVRAHGGEVRIADNVPHGAIVSFSLQLEEVCVESEYLGG